MLPKLAASGVNVASYWTFSDIFVEDWPDNDPLGHPEFVGHYGLETVSGIAKPVRRAFELLHQFAGERLLQINYTNTERSGAAATAGSGAGAGCIVTKDLGCFDQKRSKDHCLDSADQAHLPWRTQPSQRLSVSTCLEFCANRGAADSDGGVASFMGLEAGNGGKECWCSSQPFSRNGSCPSAAESQCSLPCPGAANESCGGPWRIRGFAIKCSPPPPISEHPQDDLPVFATCDDRGNDNSSCNAISIFLSTWDERARRISGVVLANDTGCPLSEESDARCTCQIVLNLPRATCAIQQNNSYQRYNYCGPNF